jgi:hypothetical protein
MASSYTAFTGHAYTLNGNGAWTTSSSRPVQHGVGPHAASASEADEVTVSLEAEEVDHSFCICLSRIEEFANINTMSKEYTIVSSAWLASIAKHAWSKDVRNAIDAFITKSVALDTISEVFNLDACSCEEIDQLWFDCFEGQRDLCHEYELLKRDVIFFLPVDYLVNNEDKLDSEAADEKKKRRPRKKITRKSSDPDIDLEGRFGDGADLPKKRRQ